LRQELIRLVIEGLKESDVNFIATLPDTWMGDLGDSIASDDFFLNSYQLRMKGRDLLFVQVLGLVVKYQR
jgi:hypothetical protein